MLVAEMTNFTTDPSKDASGIIVESTLDTKKGVSATLLIKDGTLKKGSFIVAENAYSPVRFIENFRGEKIDTATASMPVQILGWNEMPTCGAPFKTVESKKEAEKLTEQFKEKNKEEMNNLSKAVPKQIETDENGNPIEKSVVILPVIIKADVIGSLEGVLNELKKIQNEKVILKIISEGIGEINENDVKMAQSDPNTIILGFNVKPDRKTAAIIDRASIPINVKTFRIIYELSEYVAKTVLEKVPKEYVEEITGSAKILALFSREKDKQVVGGKVESGTISIGIEVKIIRRGSEIGRGKIRELQSKKQRVNEVAEGFEFGMLVESKMEIAIGDRVEAVRTVEKQ